MKQNKTEIVVILDRSGSMQSCKEKMQNALYEFVGEQKKEKGECLFSFYRFDTDYEAVLEGVNLQKVTNNDLDLVPRGGTALNDALGRSINSIGDRLSKTDESERPEKVIFCIITDGEENASKEFTKDKIKEMVKHQIEKYNWKFLFLGTDIDAIQEASKYGIAKTTAINFSKTDAGISGASAVLTKSISFMRNADLQCYSGYTFSDEDRTEALGMADVKVDARVKILGEKKKNARQLTKV